MSLGEMTQGKLKILKAVASLLEDPSAKITIARIAKSIHVTDAAIYRHYKSKDEIFSSLLGYMETNLLGPLNAMQKDGGDTYNKMKTVFSTYIDFLEGHPGLARLLLGHGANEATGVAERIKLLHAKMRAQMAQVLRFGQGQGDLDEDLSPEQATEILYGMLVGASMAQAYGFPQVDAVSRWEAFSSTVFNKRLRAA